MTSMTCKQGTQPTFSGRDYFWAHVEPEEKASRKFSSEKGKSLKNLNIKGLNIQKNIYISVDQEQLNCL